MRAPALRLRHAGREPFKGEDEELTFPARLPPHADSHRSQNSALSVADSTILFCSTLTARAGRCRWKHSSL